MEHRDVSPQEIPRRRKIRLPQPIQPDLVGLGQPEAENQRRRWLELTQVTLPAMARAARWPIRLDHCFMRVLLDNALGGVWHHTVARPAIRHLSPAQLDAALALGATIVADPARLPELNRRSLAWRGKTRV